MLHRSNQWLYVLIAGDILTLALVTIFGFASHGTVDTAGSRILTTFAPLTAAWFLIAPHLMVYKKEIAYDFRQLWRPFWAIILAAPMAAWLRGVILNASILPLFVLIIGGVSALAILLWRVIFWLVAVRMKQTDG
jgi:hypothetical protein